MKIQTRKLLCMTFAVLAVIAGFLGSSMPGNARIDCFGWTPRGGMPCAYDAAPSSPGK